MNKLSVLVLEDHAFQRAVTINALQELNITQLYSAAEGSEALQLLDQTGPVDIVVCDLNMPGMDGLAFLRQASERKLIKAVILCSEIAPDLRRAVLQMIKLLNVTVLANFGKPLQQEPLKNALNKYQIEPAASSFSAPEYLFSQSDILQALARHEFRAYYQPKFELKTMNMHGAEVLVRWQHPQYGLLSPAHFLYPIEAFNCFDPLLLSLLEQGLALQSQLLQQGHPLVELAFNLHPSQLSSLTLTSKIQNLLRQYQRAASTVTFEVTEVGLLDTPEIAMENLIRLRMMGCGLSIDDFGIGYSSLQRLTELPFNQIKLDASFIQTYEEQPRCKSVILSTLALAESLGMQLVIEGVETEKQRQILMSLGATLAQGYLYAKPMSQNEYLSWQYKQSKRIPARSALAATA